MVPPPLAQYCSRMDYKPRYGDLIIWSKWFSTWHGFVIGIDKETNTLQIVFAGVPFLLLTMHESEHETETKYIKLRDIQRAPNGKYAIQTIEGQATVWYI